MCLFKNVHRLTSSTERHGRNIDKTLDTFYFFFFLSIQCKPRKLCFYASQLHLSRFVVTVFTAAAAVTSAATVFVVVCVVVLLFFFAIDLNQSSIVFKCNMKIGTFIIHAIEA